MVNIDVTIQTLFGQGQTGAVLWWKYTDDETGAVISPTPRTGALFDPTLPISVQRDPSNTALTTSSTFTPTIDTTGAITGMAGAAYVIVNFDNNAPIGQWYISTTFTWVTKTQTKNIGFFVLASGASVSTASAIATGTVYTDAKQVQDFLQLQGFFDANSVPTQGIIQQYIRLAEGDFDDATGTSYRMRFVQDEEHNMESIRESHFDFPDYDFLPHPIQLDHRPLIVPLDPARGHRLEVYEGGTTTPTPSDPVGRWTDWLLTKVYGRNRDYDYDRWEQGQIRLRKFLIRRASMVRVSYEYGKPITLVTNAVLASATSISVGSTFRYDTRGVVRIGSERIFHTGKTTTGLTGCIRGYEGTIPADIATGSEVYEVPDDVNRLATVKAAMRFLQSDLYTAKTAEGQLTSPAIADRIREWQAEWTEGLKKYQRWGLI